MKQCHFIQYLHYQRLKVGTVIPFLYKFWPQKVKNAFLHSSLFIPFLQLTSNVSHITKKREIDKQQMFGTQKKESFQENCMEAAALVYEQAENSICLCKNQENAPNNMFVLLSFPLKNASAARGIIYIFIHLSIWDKTGVCV